MILIIFSFFQIPTLPPEHFDEAWDRFAGGNWRKMRGLHYLILQRKREVMERQGDYANWKELCEGFASKPKHWKIWVKKMERAPVGWDPEHHPPWPPGGATVFHATLPSANRSDTKASEYANDKHPMVSVDNYLLSIIHSSNTQLTLIGLDLHWIFSP